MTIVYSNRGIYSYQYLHNDDVCLFITRTFSVMVSISRKMVDGVFYKSFDSIVVVLGRFRLVIALFRNEKPDCGVAIYCS